MNILPKSKIKMHAFFLPLHTIRFPQKKYLTPQNLLPHSFKSTTLS